MSKLINLLERLAEMFPRQDYQSRLDRYIASRNPKTAADVEHHMRTFKNNEFRGLGL